MIDRTTALAAAFVLLLASCSSSTEPGTTLWEGDLTAVPPGTLRGTVAAVSQFGRTQTSIRIRQAAPNATYSWRISEGTCQNAGTVQGGTALYPLLETGDDGSAEVSTTLPGVFGAGASYAARVLGPAEEDEDQVVACGELVPR